MHAKAATIHNAKNKKAGGLEFTATCNAKIDIPKSNAAVIFISPMMSNGERSRAGQVVPRPPRDGLPALAGAIGSPRA
jgi:hypothetical protein